MTVSDAMDAFSDWATKISLFGETKKTYTRYMEVRDWIKYLSLADAERKAVVAADRRVHMFDVPIMIADAGPPAVWTWNREVRRVQNRFLRVIGRQPIGIMAVYTISAYFTASYAHAQIIDKFFTRDGGIVQLTEKYQRDAGGEGAKSDKAPDGSIYHLDDISDGVTSGTTDA